MRYACPLKRTLSPHIFSGIHILFICVFNALTLCKYRVYFALNCFCGVITLCENAGQISVELCVTAEDKSAQSITSICYALQAKPETHTQTELFITLLTLFQFSFSILKKKDISYCISFKEKQENSIYDYQRII